MSERIKHYPLVLWEHTQDAKQQYQDAERRFQELGYFRPDVSFTTNGIPVVFRNSSVPYYEQRGLNAIRALEAARHYGATGYFDSGDIVDFRKGTGPIVDMEMEDLGFRKSKKDPSKWAKRDRDDHARPATHAHWDRLYGVDIDALDASEQERLRRLRPVRNLRTSLGSTYSIESARTGMIYVALDANPFADGGRTENLWILGEQLAQRGHVNKVQEGVTLVARNVVLDSTDFESHDSVHIRATKSEERVEEVVWPATTDARTAVDLAADLRDRIQGRQRVYSYPQSINP